MSLRRLAAGLAARGVPRRTLRLRLTAVYGVLFLLSGAGLLAITYAFASNATATGCARTAQGVGFCIHSAPSQAGHLQEAAGQAALVPPGGHARPMALSLGQAEALIASQHANEMHQLLAYSGLALAIMAVICVALGWAVAGRVLRPLRTITAAARDISATSLGRRLALAGPDDEIKELGDTFDGLLGRLEAAFAAQRQFVANASHELRTPLAWQRTLAQVALADPGADAASLRAAHERALAAGAHQERIIEALLTLTRGQAGLGKRQPFDLADLAGQVVAARRGEAAARQLRLHTALAAAPAAGDPQLAERLIANLADNALRHNVPGGHAEVVTGTRGSQAVLSVINTGPEVPPEAIGPLLQPFQRLGTDRTGHGEGLGLGLSIVEAIAGAHGATLAIRPRPGGGLQAEVSFPVPAPVRGAGGGRHPAAESPAHPVPAAPR